MYGTGSLITDYFWILPRSQVLNFIVTRSYSITVGNNNKIELDCEYRITHHAKSNNI